MRPNKKRGSALLTVLWLTAALAATGIAVASSVRGETERAATQIDDVKAYFAARGAIDRAAMHMQWGRDFYIPGMPAMDFDFPDAVAHVELIPESSKLNLNAVRPEELLRLLPALGMPEDRATEAANAILDWRRPDPLHQSPFDSFYLAQTPSFLPRHASFQENEELLQVKGITPDLYFGDALDDNHAGLRDCVTVYANGGGVDINTARPATLVAIGLAPADAESIVKSRAVRPVLDPQQLASIVQAVGPAGARLRMGGEGTFTLRASARLKRPDGTLSDLRRTTAAVVRFWQPGNPLGKPASYEIVRWFDRG